MISSGCFFSSKMLLQLYESVRKSRAHQEKGRKYYKSHQIPRQRLKQVPRRKGRKRPKKPRKLRINLVIKNKMNDLLCKKKLENLTKILIRPRRRSRERRKSSDHLRVKIRYTELYLRSYIVTDWLQEEIDSKFNLSTLSKQEKSSLNDGKVLKTASIVYFWIYFVVVSKRFQVK